MENNSNIETGYANLHIGDTGESGLVLGDELLLPPDATPQLFVIGQFLSARTIHFDSMQSTLASIRRPVKGVTATETDIRGRYLFQFYHELDIARVLKDGPWTFNQNVMVVHQLQTSEQASQIELHNLIIWVQIYDLPIDFQTEAACRALGNDLGRFIDSDLKNFTGIRRSYLRIKVTVDTRKSLKIGQFLQCRGGPKFWVAFKYERLPQFCFYCGMLGHTDKFCNALYDNPDNPSERRYGSSLRATIRKPGNLNGIAWLHKPTEEFDDVFSETDSDTGSAEGSFRKNNRIFGFPSGASKPHTSENSNMEEGVSIEPKRKRLVTGNMEIDTNCIVQYKNGKETGPVN